MQFSLEFSKPRCYVKISLASYRTAMARLFTCADVLEQLVLEQLVLEQLEDSNGDVSSGDDSAYEDSRIPGTDDMDLDAAARRGLTV